MEKTLAVNKTRLLFIIENDKMLLIGMYYLPFKEQIIFFVVFGTWPKIGSFRLPIHRRDAYMKFF